MDTDIKDYKYTGNEYIGTEIILLRRLGYVHGKKLVNFVASQVVTYTEVDEKKREHYMGQLRRLQPAFIIVFQKRPF